MIEFNPDGSIKLPDKLKKQDEELRNRLKFQKCIKIKKEIVNFKAPKKCVLKITLSDAIKDIRFIDNIYNEFKIKASTPTQIKKVTDKEFEIIIETDFRRCTDCSSLISRYKEFLNNNLIEIKGNCTFEGRKSSFSFEDYF